MTTHCLISKFDRVIIVDFVNAHQSLDLILELGDFSLFLLELAAELGDFLFKLDVVAYLVLTERFLLLLGKLHFFVFLLDLDLKGGFLFFKVKNTQLCS